MLTSQHPKYLWWFPPELADADEFPHGMWLVDDDLDGLGVVLAAGPSTASPQWLAQLCACPIGALTRAEDVEVGLYARRPDGSKDFDRVERWITCPVWLLTTSKEAR